MKEPDWNKIIPEFQEQLWEEFCALYTSPDWSDDRTPETEKQKEVALKRMAHLLIQRYRHKYFPKSKFPDYDFSASYFKPELKQNSPFEPS